MIADQVHYCPHCGNNLIHAERAGKIRPVCPSCDWIYFPDPKVAVAVLIEENSRVLLVKRAHNPYRGKWMLPAGFVDAGEDPREAAVREVKEETHLDIRITDLIDVIGERAYDGGADILIVFRANIVSGELKAGDDAAGAGFFSPKELPPMAFPSSKDILKHINVT
jgi:ADP-ribose pyrophosphatase YjhB (NUDIX family)